VNEVDKDGHVVHLESTDIPQTIKSEKEENNGSESVSSCLSLSHRVSKQALIRW
jgi:hypothetical protein